MQVAGLNHLAHEFSSGLVVLGLLFSLLDPTSEIGQLAHILLDLLLLDGLFLLLLLDLGLGPSPLGPDLEQAGAHALGDCSKEGGQAVKCVRHLRDTAVLILNAAAMSGSSSIWRPFLSVSSSFLSSIKSLTQSVKV